ncbi:sugar nucleotide-binding protein [Microbulbifer hydrolyticus]|uniref:dTDP-4-dehydrorhamnose reductase n=1 Tax=Microbulbifer hydrolyticus TaxID=48074 RepID=A0A6P1TBE7_9GAMM|nr:sugar nucleotide-binding protein [Microbulbifer hydrolyticus]MBB5212455.1 dTDP-4-dehydrorhamnose reductase [Microbulbifer hydrolyticus]QHQ40084.1 sugar nucleotide-binding protein [Microbulbifer hydrolyticus]
MHHTGYQPDTVALIGAGNAIDSALQKGLQKVGFRVQLVGREQLTAEKFPARSGTIVINAASCGGGALMAEARAVCEALKGLPFTALLHLSSYGVFGRARRKKIDEEEEPSPSSERGRDWLACEEILSAVDNVSILRLGWQVDRSEDALLGRILRSLLEGRPVILDDTSKGNPVTVADLVRVAVAITQQLASGGPKSGLYHYGSADTCTAMEFGREVIDRVRSLYGEDFAAELAVLAPAEEDRSSVLSCGRLRDVFGIQQRSWRQGLTRQVELWLERLQKPEV